MALSFQKTENSLYKSTYVASAAQGTFMIVNVGRGAKPWRASFEDAGGTHQVVGAEKHKTLSSAMAAAEAFAQKQAELEATKAALREEAQRRVDSGESVFVDDAVSVMQERVVTQAFGILGITEHLDESSSSRITEICDPRKIKATLKKQHGVDKRTCGSRKLVTPMYILWRMDGDMYQICSRLASVGLTGSWMSYEALVSSYGYEGATDRRSGKGGLKSLDRYLRECELGTKLQPFGWRLETEGRQPKSKTWAGSKLRIVPIEGWQVPQLNDTDVPLVLLPVHQAELFCAARFGETRSAFGLAVADDYASDNGQSTDEYIAEHNNPADDPAWFIEAMGDHGFKPVTR